MTRDEFRQWIEFHSSSFPLAMTKLVENQRWMETREKWYGLVFENIGFREACEITNSMVRGEIQHPAQYELDRLPAAMLEAYREAKRKERSEMSEWELDARKAQKTRITDGETHSMYRWILAAIQSCKDDQLRDFVAAGNSPADFVVDSDLAVAMATDMFRDCGMWDKDNQKVTTAAF